MYRAIPAPAANCPPLSAAPAAQHPRPTAPAHPAGPHTAEGCRTGAARRPAAEDQGGGAAAAPARGQPTLQGWALASPTTAMTLLAWLTPCPCRPPSSSCRGSWRGRARRRTRGARCGARVSAHWEPAHLHGATDQTCRPPSPPTRCFPCSSAGGGEAERRAGGRPEPCKGPGSGAGGQGAGGCRAASRHAGAQGEGSAKGC